MKSVEIWKFNMLSKTAILIIVGYGLSAAVLGCWMIAPIFLLHTAVFPIVFRICTPLQRKVIFLNGMHWPLGRDFEDPASCGLEGVRNLYIEHNSKVNAATVEIGIWHLLPASVYERLKTKLNEIEHEKDMSMLYDEEMATSGKSIMLYCHGNSNNRAAPHRIKLYKILQSMDFHVITFDYRGYGDSSPVCPSEKGVVEDTLIVYDWVLTTIHNASGAPPVFIWAHSLGTGISSHLLGNLEMLSVSNLERSECLPLPRGLILESPFNNMRDEVENHFLIKLVHWLPYYREMFVEPFATNAECQFKSDVHLTKAKSLRILVLHAKDDYVVPYTLGVKLYETVLASRTSQDAPITLHSFEKSERLGHKWICNAADFHDTVRNFTDAP